jgi:hypothetical protein
MSGDMTILPKKELIDRVVEKHESTRAVRLFSQGSKPVAYWAETVGEKIILYAAYRDDVVDCDITVLLVQCALVDVSEEEAQEHPISIMDTLHNIVQSGWEYVPVNAVQKFIFNAAPSFFRSRADAMQHIYPREQK